MNFNFSLNELESYALSTSRWDEYYNSVRKDHGYQPGDYLSADHAYELLQKSYIVVKDEWQDEYFFIGRERFDLSIIEHAFEVVMTMERLKRELQYIHIHGMKSAPDARKVRRELAALLSSVEW